LLGLCRQAKERERRSFPMETSAICRMSFSLLHTHTHTQERERLLFAQLVSWKHTCQKRKKEKEEKETRTHNRESLGRSIRAFHGPLSSIRFC
jgi:hypothetical protein